MMYEIGQPRNWRRWIVTTATDRHEAEQAFHNAQADERAGFFLQHPKQLQFDAAGYLDHETWIRPAMAQFGDVAGKQVLDFGCGHGMAAVVLARCGGRVTAFDISDGYLTEATTRARTNEVAIQFLKASGELLPFADQ